MKFRRVVLGSLAFLALLLALVGGRVVLAPAKTYGFLGNAEPVRIFTDPVPGGSAGREARYYFLKGDLKELEAAVKAELAPKGWARQIAPDGSVLYQGRPAESVWLQRADRLKDPRLKGAIPESPREWIVVRTVDPRAGRLIRRKLIEWGKGLVAR